jgi:D-aspartate ligase
VSSGVAAINQRDVPAAAGSHRPPVIILNLFYSGLAIARDLAGKGVRVVGLSSQRGTYGNSTRFCQVRFCPNSQEQPEKFVNYLLQVATELRGAIVFPTRDADVVVLDRFREELQPFYRLAIPPAKVLQRVTDKYALVQAAEVAGVPVPRSALVTDAARLSEGVDRVGFPCVVKPVKSVHWRGAENWNLVGGRKAFLASDFPQLQSEYGRLARVHPELLLQEWIPGSADQIVVLGGYVGDRSIPLTYFTARKIVQSPDDFGTGCVVESDEIPALLDLTLPLWRVLEYQGMAEVEYKRDVRDGKLKLIEINTRHWDWHQLGAASGINLTWTAYCHLSGRLDIPAQKPIRRAKWIAEDELLMHISRGVYRRQFSPRVLHRQLSGPRMFGIFKWNDPLPFLRHCLSVLPALAKAAANKLLGRSSHP